MTTDNTSYRTTGLTLAEVREERERQDAKWGEQNHPDGTGEHYATLARHHRRLCDEMFAKDRGAWAHILREEVYEALAEDNPVKLRAELIQVAAVAVSWVEAIDRREGGLSYAQACEDALAPSRGGC